MPELSERELGANQERRRIVGLILAEYGIWKLAGELRIANVLDQLATKVQLDHREDNER